MSHIFERFKKRLEGGSEPVEGMMIIYPCPVALTVAEAKELIAARPQHAFAVTLHNAIKGMPPEKEIFCEHADLQALVEDGEAFLEVKVEQTSDGPRRVASRRFLSKAAVVSHAHEPSKPTSPKKDK